LSSASRWEAHFAPFRSGIIGIDATIDGSSGKLPIVYADWIASGRLYRPIEERLTRLAYPYVANTHSESSALGSLMTAAYRRAHALIKERISANADDVVVTAGSGMTGVVNKLQRILGLRVSERARGLCGIADYVIPEDERPVVFLTHMEHHSNHTSWLESLADVVVLEPDGDLRVDPAELERQLQRYAKRPLKIGSFSAGSNVTGVRPPYRELARLMHRAGGLAFADFAAAAPYDPIVMKDNSEGEGDLDAVFFSPHKFLGGPGSPGILVFDRRIYANSVPDDPGGGTVSWTNRWGEYHYVEDIESREDGGTPAFLGAMRAALALELKELMGCEAIHGRERELLGRAFDALLSVPGLKILAEDERERLGVLSFYIEGLHYNLVVRLLSDRYGIQVRGGCSCAGTYGHYLLHVDRARSKEITCKIDSGDLTEKPGWVRLSLHPTMTDVELDYCLRAIAEIALKGASWADDYRFERSRGEFVRKDGRDFRPIDPDAIFARKGLI
jgi:selenocysteine lyase/cysteine desulfurase